MSSHREAPEISKDPVADNTDTYAFVSPDRPDTVTIITNYIPLEAAAAGPNFYEFGDDVAYYIYVSNNGTGIADIAYEFRFATRVRDEDTFLYNTGPIGSVYDSHFNRRQFYTVRRIESDNAAFSAARDKRVNSPRRPVSHLHTQVLGTDLICPPCNIGPSSTPHYPNLAQEAVHSLPGGIKVFAGQRNDGFFADLGAIFDLADLRPFQSLHLNSMIANAAGIDTLKSGVNVHTIAMQIPISQLTRHGTTPSNPFASDSTIGIWGGASRRRVQVRGHGPGQNGAESGPFVQVSRLGNPLFNEVLVPLGRKDEWNRANPHMDNEFADGVIHPELAKLLPVLYPGAFPNLAKLAASNAPRADLEAILLTGLPAGVVPHFQNYTGKTLADMLRLNVAIPPSRSPNALGLLGNDPAGFPNGRRVVDDVVTIELRAIAGLTYSLVNKSYHVDKAATEVTDGVAIPPTGAPGTARFLPYFPYLGIPNDGYDTPPNPTPPPALASTR